MTEHIRAKLCLQEIEDSQILCRPSHPPRWRDMGLEDLIDDGVLRDDPITREVLIAVKGVLRRLATDQPVRPAEGIGGPV